MIKTKKKHKNLEGDSYLQIQLVRYDKRNNKNNFYFMELSTLQALRHFPYELEIKEMKIASWNDNEKYVFAEDLEKLQIKNIGDFINFYLTNSDLYIQDFETILKNGISISSHDDGEVELSFPENFAYKEIVIQILKQQDFSDKVLELVEKNIDKYIEIEKPQIIKNIFNDFDEYLQKIA